jgi:STE24 endopeptidase
LFAVVLALLQWTPAAASLGSTATRLFPSTFWLRVLCVALAVHGFLYAAGFPLKLYGGYRLEKEYGLSNENLRRWLGDELKSLALSLAFSLALIEAFYAAVLRWPDHWWAVFGAIWIGAVLALSAIFPSVIVPLFYPMKPLAAGPVRDRILGLAKRLGVRVKGVYEIALSRKTRKANAAVLGIGGLRRIVMGDTLLKAFSPEEIDVVVSHELGHYVRGHNRLSLAVHLIGGFAGIFLFFLVSRPLASWLGGESLADLGIYPGLVLVVGCC